MKKPGYLLTTVDIFNMKEEKWTNKDLTNAIRNGGKGRLLAIRFIYEDRQLKKNVKTLVKKNGGNPQDAEDLFHEGLILMDRNIRQGKLQGNDNLKGYLFGICRFLWLNQRRKNQKEELQEHVSEQPATKEDLPDWQLFQEEQKMLLRQLLQQIGERCQRILEMWKLSYSMKEIAAEMGFSSPALAKKNKYRCYKRLIEILDERPELKNQLEKSYEP